MNTFSIVIFILVVLYKCDAQQSILNTNINENYNIVNGRHTNIRGNFSKDNRIKVNVSNRIKKHKNSLVHRSTVFYTPLITCKNWNYHIHKCLDCTCLNGLCNIPCQPDRINSLQTTSIYKTPTILTTAKPRLIYRGGAKYWLGPKLGKYLSTLAIIC